MARAMTEGRAAIVDAKRRATFFRRWIPGGASMVDPSGSDVARSRPLALPRCGTALGHVARKRSGADNARNLGC